MERNKPGCSAGDTCVLIVSIPKRYTQEFEVQGFDGKYYTVKRGKSTHHVSPGRMFKTKEDALAFLDAGDSPTDNEHGRKEKNETEADHMNEWERNRRMAEEYRKSHPPGTRIVLLGTTETLQPVPIGMRGTVDFIDDQSQIHMKWDNGRTLAVIPGEDSFRKLTSEELAEEQPMEQAEEENEDMDEGSAPAMGM